MYDEQKSTGDEMENGLDSSAQLLGNALQKGLPARRQARNPSDGQGQNPSAKPTAQGGRENGENGNLGAPKPPESGRNALASQPNTNRQNPSDAKNATANSHALGHEGEALSGSGKGVGAAAGSGATSASGGATGSGISASNASNTSGGISANSVATTGGGISAGSGAAAGAATGTVAGPAGTVAGAAAGILIVPLLKFIGMAVATVFVFLSFFMMLPSFLFDNSGATNDRTLLENSYNNYYNEMAQEYGEDISDAIDNAQQEAWDLFRDAGRRADDGDTSLLFAAPAPYPYVSLSEADQNAIHEIIGSDAYDEFVFGHEVVYLYDYATYVQSASSNINFVMSMLDVQKKNWFVSVFEGIADVITGSHYGAFSNAVGRKWDGFWNDFIKYDLFSITYGGVTSETKTEYLIGWSGAAARGEDTSPFEKEVTVAKIKIVYHYDLKDLGVGFYANKLNLSQAQIDRATEMAHALGGLFGSAGETYFGWYVEGGYFTDAIQGGSVGANISTALVTFADKVEGMEYDPEGDHIFPMQGYAQPNMSSAYGPRNFAPDPWHTGIDFAAPTGTPVLAAADGIVLYLAQMPAGFGNYLVVYHGEQDGRPISTMYAHMSSFGSYRAGDEVSRGDVLGAVGRTGIATGPHLHFQLHVGDNVQNPVAFFAFLQYLKTG